MLRGTPRIHTGSLAVHAQFHRSMIPDPPRNKVPAVSRSNSRFCSKADSKRPCTERLPTPSNGRQAPRLPRAEHKMSFIAGHER
jgi:hypothetical protein